MKPSDFYTVPKSEEGLKIPLLSADGKDSGEWIRVKGIDSKQYARAEAAFFRALADIRGSQDPQEMEEKSLQVFKDFARAIAIDWSFDEPMTPEALDEFLANTTVFAMSVRDLASKRDLFFGALDSENSTPGPTSSDTSQAQVASDTPSG